MEVREDLLGGGSLRALEPFLKLLLDFFQSLLGPLFLFAENGNARCKKFFSIFKLSQQVLPIGFDEYATDAFVNGCFVG